MKRFIPAVLAVIAASVPVLAQTKAAPAKATDSSLADLIQAGNRKAALEKIRNGADVNAPQPDGTRPIHWAVYRLDYEVLDALIATKAKADVTNEFGSTPIAEAAKLGDLRMVKALLDAGANVEGPNQDGETALMIAVKGGELPVVQLLLDRGAKVNTIEKFHNQTALMWAAASSKNAGEMVKMLLAKGADVKPRALFSDWDSQITSEPRAQYRPVGGLTALLYAARNGCYDCVDELLGAGADVNIPTPEGVTALMLALDNEHPDVAKLLLDKGANPHSFDWWGRTALYIAIDRKEAAATPGRGGVGGGGRGGRGGGGAALAARNNSRGASSMDVINALLDAGVDTNAELNMHRPSRGGNSGRFIDPLLSTGCTPLLRATMLNDRPVMEALLAHGANPNVVDMGMTPFLVAAGVGTATRGGTGLAAAAAAGGNANVPVMDVLLEHGADINAQITGTKTYSMRISRAPSTNEGYTALHWAAQTGRLELAKYLIEHGARTDVLDSNGKKPIDLIASAAPRGGAAPPPAAAGGTAPAGRGVDAADIATLKSLLEAASAKQ
jgi:ankyrin repeat protein